MDEAQDEDGRECVREEDDPQSHIIAKGRQDPLVRPDEGRTECEVRKAARGVRGLEPRTTAPDRDEGEQPCIHRDPREDRRAGKVQLAAPIARTRRTVTVSEGRHRHRAAPVSRSSAAVRYPACRASASVRSARKARLASSMKRRANSGPVSYRARTMWPTPGTVVPSDGRTTTRATAFRSRSPSSMEKVSSPRTTARQFAREGESGRPDHEERDEPADDQEIREPNLVELAVVPEPSDEDEGDQEQESGADQECPEAGVHRLTQSPARPRTARSRRGGCGRRCPGSRSASSRTARDAGTRSR